MNESDKIFLEKIRSSERKLDMLRINTLENEVKRLSNKVEVLTKSYSDFERGDRVQVRDDKSGRELEVARVTAKCVWVKGHGDKNHF